MTECQLKCSVKDCQRAAIYSGRGQGRTGEIREPLCATCYKRKRRNGTTDHVRRQYKAGDTCEVGQCKQPVDRLGMCHNHYLRWWRTGETHGRVVNYCEMPGCRERQHSRGWCGKHYQRWVATGDPLGLGVGVRTAEERTRRLEANRMVREAMAARAAGRRRAVDDWLGRAIALDPNLTSRIGPEIKAIRMAPDRERDQRVMRDDVMRLTTRGLSARQIAARLGVSDRTVVRYRTQAKKSETNNA